MEHLPLTMPALFSLGQHSVLVAVQEQLSPDERLFAFLDPEELWTHARIQIHLGKTQIWNQGGEKPPGCDALTTDAQHHDPNAVVWKGDRTLPLDQQGLIVLGTPLGSVEFVQRELAEISVKPQSLSSGAGSSERLAVASVWRASQAKLLSPHVAPRGLPGVAAQHDSSVKRCLEHLLHTTIPDTTWPVATLPLALGGLGLRSASRGRQVSFSSSWPDVLHVVRLRHRAVAETMLEGLNSNDPRHSHIQGAVVARSRLQDLGFRPPEWHALANGERPRGFPDPDDVATPLGQIARIAQIPRRSSGGAAFLLLPVLVHAFCTSGVPCVRPPTKRTCGCGRLLDSFGHHRAACANVGVLGRRGFALESAAARACREAGDRVSVNQYVRDLDIAAPSAADNRRLEVVADGLTLFHGAQLAIDTTMVSPLSCTGVPHARCADVDGAATMGARRRKQRYLELACEDGRARLVVLACEVGERFSEECHFLREFSKFKGRDELLLQQRVRHAWLHRGSMLACSGCSGFVVAGATGRAWRGWTSTSEP